MSQYNDGPTQPYRGGRTAGKADPDETLPVNSSGYYDDQEDDLDSDDVTQPAIPGAGRSAPAAEGKIGRILIEAGQRDRGPRITFPAETASQPVCAVLLIVGGPGQGVCVPISYGRSAVGRDRSARVQLNIGDPQLSGLHFIVSYDESDRTFDLKEADAATNHTYVNDVRVRASVVLTAGDLIRAGGTSFRFIPCCGPDWSWSDVLAADKT